MNDLAAEKNRRVLVIDDNHAIHDDFRKILTPAARPDVNAAETALFGPSAAALLATRFEMDSAYQGQEGVLLVKKALAEGRPYAMAFVDVRMPPGWDGVETTRKIWERDANLQIVICTAYSDYSWGEMFEKLGQQDGLLILKKPFDAVEAFQLAHALTEKWWLHQQARRKMEELEGRVAARTQELASSLSLLNATLDSTTDGIVAVDLSGNVLSYNARFVGTWQFPADMLARRNAAEMRAYTAGQVKDAAKFLQRLAELQSAPEAESFDVVELKDGRTFERYVFPQRIEQQCVGTVINWRDITERSHSEAALRESKRFLRSTLDALSSHIAILEPDGTIVEVNAAWNQFAIANNFSGSQRGAGDNYLQLCDAASGPCFEEASLVAGGIRAVMAGQRDEFSLEYPCHSPQMQRWFIVRVTRFAGAGPVRVVVAHENITERKLAEEELQWKTAFLEAQVNSSSDGILVVDPKGKKILQNQRLVDLFQIPPAIADGTADADQVAWVTGMTKNPETFGERVRYLYAHPEEISRDEIALKDRRTLDRYSAPVVGQDGRHYGRIWTFRDITERKQADEVLRRTEALYRAAIAGVGAVPYSLNFKTGVYAFIGEGIQSLIGYAPHEISGQIWKQIIQESVMAGEMTGLSKDEAARRMAAGELRNWRCDMRVRMRDGKSRWLSDASVQHLDAAGLPIGSMGILQDITERKRNEISAVAFSKLGSRLSSVTSARETFGIVHEISRELFGWDAFCIRLYRAEQDSIYAGYTVDTIDGRTVVEDQREPLPPGELYRRIMEQGGELIRRDSQPNFAPGIIPFGNLSRPSATLMFVPIRSRGRAVGVLTVQSYAPHAYDERDLETLQTMADQCGDAFERIWADDALRHTQAQLFQAQKLETVGKLAGGVAHEFNSILTAIIGQSELILGDLPPGHALSENVADIHKAAGRAATLTRQLLAYGRRTLLQPESLDLNQVLASMTDTIRQLLGLAVDVRTAPARDLHAVKADAGQIEQVIMNLVMNAAAAMPHGGKLTLETANVSFVPERHSPDLKPGDYVMLAVTDTGTGMSAAVRARIFEPFFTTKGVGEGTGLGLSTCYGIIKQSGGHISVYSEPGRGTTFKIYLPEAVPESKPPARRPVAADLPKGTETILLVEDDPALREVAATLLRRLGYTVLTAANGVEALRLHQESATSSIALLFTDVVMPHLSGRELADRVRAANPQAKILFTTAYTEQSVLHQGVLDQGVALLQKPFTPSALAHKVREVLDQTVPSGTDLPAGNSSFTKSAGAAQPSEV